MPKTKQPRKAQKAKAPYPNPRRKRNGNQGMVSAPVSQSRALISSTPNISRKLDSITIAHREFFASVGTASASGTFEVSTFQVNPGNQAMFPWLSSQAFGWERYRFKKLDIIYVPRCATTQAGSLILSPDYDAADEAPTSEAQACSYADAVSSVPWGAVTLKLRPEPLAGGMKSKYIRVGALKSNLDVKTYDAASLHVCRDSGGGVTPVWGKLWVDYVVELITPHTLPTPWTSTFAGANQTTPQAANLPFFGTATATNVVEMAGPIAVTNSTLNGASNTDKLNIDGLVAGAQYIISFLAEASAPTTAIVSAAPTLVGLTVLNTLTSGFTWVPGGAGIKQVMHEVLAQATATAGSYTAVLSGAAIRGAQLVISQVIPDSAWTLL